MEPIDSLARPLITRRRFFTASLAGSAGVALYSTAIARHWIEVTHPTIHLPGLHAALDGLRVAQISDIHMDEYTEPFFLHSVIDRVNRLQPDLVLLTGDFVSFEITSKHFAIGSAWQCANILTNLKCKQIFSVLGNHDVSVDAKAVTKALTANGIPVLTNTCVPIERGGGRLWLAGVDDPVAGDPDQRRRFRLPSAMLRMNPSF